jgi:hypothetical protein
MKKLATLACLVALPFVALAEDAKSDTAKEPKKNVISSYRVFVKDGHTAAFKSALAAHAQKFHNGPWKWRVYSVNSGPEEGSYQIIEGPNSWTELDDRGDLGAEHTKDYETNVLPHLDKTLPTSYLTYEADLSTVPLGAFSNKAIITHGIIKTGRLSAATDGLKAWNASWVKQGINIAVYRSFASGESEFVVVRRLRNGLKDLDADIMSSRKAFEETGGPNAYTNAQEELTRDYSKLVAEMIEFQPDLSSK